MNTITDLNAVASACSPEVSQLSAVALSSSTQSASPRITPPSIHAMGSTYVLSAAGAGFDANAVVAGARVRDAKQAAPPRGILH